MPPDNAEEIAPGEDVSFPRNGVIANTNIGRTGDSTILLAAVGTYLVLFQVSVTQSAQLVLTLNDDELDYTVTGRAAGTSPIVGMAIVTTTAANSILTLRNPEANEIPLTITPESGGEEPVSAHLIVLQLA